MVDQAQKLRELVRVKEKQARVLTVTSGKGGVGKTSTCVNLAIALSACGMRVSLLDADLGLANVEVLLGLNSLFNLQHVISGEKKMSQILVKGPGNISIVPGSSGLAKLADLHAPARQNVLNGLQELQSDFDFVLIDTMAGIGENAVSFAAAADEVLLVTTPEPSAIVDAYAMIKTIYTLNDDAVLRVVVNMVSSPELATAVSTKLSRVTQQYLDRNLSFLGYIPRDNHVSQAVMQTNPFLLRYPTCPASKCIQELASRLIHQRVQNKKTNAGFFRKFAQTLGLASNG